MDPQAWLQKSPLIWVVVTVVLVTLYEPEVHFAETTDSSLESTQMSGMG